MPSPAPAAPRLLPGWGNQQPLQGDRPTPSPPSIAPAEPPGTPPAARPAPAQAGAQPHRIDPSPAGSPLHGGSPGSPRTRPGCPLRAAGGCHGASPGFSGLSYLRTPGGGFAASLPHPQHVPERHQPSLAPLERCCRGPRNVPTLPRGSLRTRSGCSPCSGRSPPRPPLGAPHRSAAGGTGSGWGRWCPVHACVHGPASGCSSLAAPDAAAAPGGSGAGVHRRLPRHCQGAEEAQLHAGSPVCLSKG